MASKPAPPLRIKRKPDSQRDCVYGRKTVGAPGHAWCPGCKTVLHKDCADELGRCPSLGCPGELTRFTPNTFENRGPRKISTSIYWGLGGLAVAVRIFSLSILGRKAA